MKEINVLLIDDSSFVHVLLEKVLNECPDIRLVGNAYSGAEGIKLNEELQPDVVIMDITMPGMSGLDAIAEIMEQRPVPIIVFSCAGKEIIDLSFQAIERGAVDILEKPDAGDIDMFREQIHGKLVKDIRMFGDFKVVRRRKMEKPVDKPADRPPPAPVRKQRTATADNRPALSAPVLGIAASTGGPQTVKRLLQFFQEKGLHTPTVLIQHMAANFIQGYCNWLNQSAANAIVLAGEGERVMDKIYVAPGHVHLIVDQEGCFRFQDTPPIAGIRPSATILFKSMAMAFRERLLVVILTGMGDDGAKSLEVVRACGGFSIAQSEQSCLLFGMPKAAIATGLVDKVLDLDAIPDFIAQRCHER